MKIGIIGAGAMGSLYGGLLSKQNDVYLIDIWKEHIDCINRDGLKIVEDKVENIVYPKATTDSKLVPHLDLVIVFVKSIHTLKAIQSNQDIILDDTVVLSLQNGYGNTEDIETLVKRENIIVGTTSHGATLLGPGKIKHAGVGMTYIGALDEKSRYKAEKIKGIMQNCGIDAEVSENILELIWSKLIINIAINPLTAILKIENGKLLESSYSLDLMKDLVYESVSIAKEIGLNLEKDETLEKVKNVANNTYSNKSSMLQDILNKRETEIDKINGAVVKVGEKVGISTPINSTIVKLVKSMNDLK